MSLEKGAFFSLVAILCLLILSFGGTQFVGATTGWNKTYGGGRDEAVASLVSTNDGGYAIAGTTDSFGAGKDDFWLVKTDAFGNMLWNKTYGGPENDCASGLIQTEDGGYVIAGTTWSCGAGGSDVWLVKTDSLGNLQWSQTCGGIKDDSAFVVGLTANDGFSVIGNTQSYGVGGNNGWLVLVDSLGNPLTNTTWAVEPNDIATAAVQTSFGWEVACSSASHPFVFYHINWTESTLQGPNYVQTSRTFSYWADYAKNGDLNFVIRNIIKTGESDDWTYINYLAVGVDNGGFGVAKFSSTQHGGLGSDFYDIAWKKEFVGSETGEAWALVPDGGSGFVLTGNAHNPNSSGNDCLVVRIDAEGNMQWSQRYGGTGNDEARSILRTDDGGYLIAGFTDSQGAGVRDFWLFKTDENGIVPEFPEAVLILPLLVIAAIFLLSWKKCAKSMR
jgi:hypothetical protein